MHKAVSTVDRFSILERNRASVCNWYPRVYDNDGLAPGCHQYFLCEQLSVPTKTINIRARMHSPLKQLLPAWAGGSVSMCEPAQSDMLRRSVCT